MKSPRQGGLFDDDSGTDSVALVSVAAGARPLSAAQRRFNRLTEGIRRERETLASWDAYAGRLAGRVAAELEPLERAIREAQRRLARRLDELLTAPQDHQRLTRKHRAKARWHLLQIVDSLLHGGSDPELEALHERYSGLSRDERLQQDMEIAEALVSGILGPGVVRGHKARDVEELFEHASEKFAERAESKGRRRGRRERDAKDERAAERKAQAARDASRSVREIYRKLVSALHPDRETDPAERDRKTLLMQRANRAYESGDLLELLALQIDIEQIEADALGSVPEERIGHYNDVLREQLQALKAQTEERVTAFRLEFDLIAAVVAPQHVDQALDARIAEARAVRDEIERALGLLDDPRQRRSLLDALPEPQEADMLDLGDLAELAELFGDAPSLERAPARRRRGKRRQRR